jgi:vitamin B12 transporter
MLDETQLRSTYLNHHRTDVYTPNIYFQKEDEFFGRTGLGLEYGQERINSTNLGRHHRGHKSVYWDISKIMIPELSLGSSFRADDYQGFGQAYSGSLKFRYTITERGSLFFGLSRSIRIPNFTELYYNDPTTIGNSGLSEGESSNFEAGFDYKKERFSYGIASFLRNEEDFIDWIKRTPAQSKWRAENVTEAQVFGIESYLRVKIGENVFLDSNYTYIDKRIDECGYLYKYGQNYIRHKFNTVFNLNLPFGIQTIGLSYKKKPNRDGWLLVSAYSGYNLNKYSQIFLRITNLLNVEYQEIEGIPQPGRWVEAGMRLEW